MSHQKWSNIWIIFAVIASGFAAFSILELQSSNGLLDDIARIQPGTNLDPIKSKLGQEIDTIDDLDQMLHIGSIKDRKFCEGKRLHRFVGAKWPWREVEIYTDKTDIVVFVTWQQE